MKITTRELVYMAFYVALFMILDTFVNTLSILQMPNGGSLGVSTIALLMASYHLGWQKGLLVAFVSIAAQFITGPMYTPNLLGFGLDYFLAFSAYGFASIFPNIKNVYTGVIVSNLVRFLCSTVSGVVVWQTTWWASLKYNALYMIPTLILGVVLIPILMKVMKPLLKTKKESVK
ncbi:MAG: energy-coupled thiamine transporter ThiT [Breznakia sp.]